MIDTCRQSPLSRRQWLQNVSAMLAVGVVPACTGDRGGPVEDFEVCVVGSGPAGTVLALELAKRGVRTLLLEGGAFDTDRRETRYPPHVLEMTAREPVNYPIKKTRFLGIGGTSNVWTANCPRSQPRDFETANAFVPRDAEWPIRYDDIEPYYVRAERELDVRGGPGNRFSPPRGAELPSDPERDASCLRDLIASAGCAVETVPVSHASRMAVAHVPQFIQEPSGRFLWPVRVVGILTGPNGRVSGLSARNGDQSMTIRAEHYVLACGGIEAPRLMLGSRTSEFPAGVGNAFDQVGRNFAENIWMDVGTIRLPSSRGCDPQQSISWQYYEELKQQGLGGAIFEFAYLPSESSVRVSAVIEMKPVPMNRISLSNTAMDALGFAAAQVSLRISDSDRATWTHVKKVGRQLAQALNGVEYREGTLRSWSHHHTGTCRMGTDPRTSVVDENLKVHGTENLYVAGSSSFVTGGVGSPTLLLTALSLRLADHLVATLRGPG